MELYEGQGKACIFPLDNYLHHIGRKLPGSLRSLRAMLETMPLSDPGTIRTKKKIHKARERTPNGIGESESDLMQIILWTMGIFRNRPYLRCVFLHHLVYAVLTENNFCPFHVLNFLEKLYYDTTNRICHWEAVCFHIMQINSSALFGLYRTPVMILSRTANHQTRSAHLTPTKSFSLTRNKNSKTDHGLIETSTNRSIDGIALSSFSMISKTSEQKNLEQGINHLTCVFLIKKTYDFVRLLQLRAFQELMDAALPPSLILLPSNNLLAGLGLFLRGRLPANTRIGFYTGLVTPKEEIEVSCYALEFTHATAIDSSSFRCLAAMINDYRDDVNQTSVNARIYAANGVNAPVVKTTRVVENEEILINYGEEFSLHPLRCSKFLQRMRDGIPF